MKTAAVAVTLVSSVLIVVLAVYVARHRRVAGGLPLTVVLAAGAFGYWAYAMELWTTGPARQTWGDIKYIGVVIVPPAFLAFNLAYTGRGRWLTRRLLTVLAVVPIAVLTLVSLPGTHDWVRQYEPGQLQATFGSARLGPVGNVFVIYSAAMVAAAAGLTIFTLARISRLYRRQVTVLVIALAIPWVFNVLFTFNIDPFARFDPTAEAFLLAGVVLVWGVFRFRLVDLAPLAMAAVVAQMPEAVIVLDAYQRVVDINPAGQALVSSTKADAVGTVVTDLLRWPGGLSTLMETTAEVIVTNGPVDRDYEAAVSPLSTGPGRPAGGHLVVVRDITERKAAQAHLERMAHHDLLTGLPNRILFDDRFELALSAARRRLQPLAVAYLDLDGFKPINDTFGHDVGDRVLQVCAQRLAGSLRGDDAVSRMGGDEFVVLLREVNGERGVLAAATKLLESLAAPIVLHGVRASLTASIGVALWPEHGLDQRSLLRAADEAMYLAKRRGGNQVVVATATGRDQSGQLALGEELRHGLEQRELHPFFQPVVTLAGDTAMMEAELRWHHPRRGLLGPADFQTAAAQAGLRRPLRRLMLSEAANNAGEWDRRLGRHVAVSVRLGRWDLTDAVLLDEVEELAAGAVEGQRLVVEFADGQNRVEHETILPGLQALKERGIRLSLDDFGAGPTPTERLLEMPLDQVKLDGPLIDKAVRESRARRVLGTVIGLAHDLDLSVVGKGSEGTDQFRVLRDLGCDLILPRRVPLSSTAAAAWLTSA